VGSDKSGAVGTGESGRRVDLVSRNYEDKVRAAFSYHRLEATHDLRGLMNMAA